MQDVIFKKCIWVNIGGNIWRYVGQELCLKSKGLVLHLCMLIFAKYVEKC